jgi:hypothetical protein
MAARAYSSQKSRLAARLAVKPASSNIVAVAATSQSSLADMFVTSPKFVLRQK